MTNATAAVQQAGPFEVVFACRDTVSFIGAYNKRPVVLQLSIRATDGRNYSGASVEVAVSSVGQVLSEPWVREIALGPAAVTWTSQEFSDLRLDSNMMLQIAEPQHAEITLTIRCGDAVLAAVREDIDLLAPDSWVSGYPLDAFAIDLAALVQPQEPLLGAVLKKASAILQARTGDGGLSGYQSADDGDFTYVDAMVESIWEAARGVGITYSNPPNSWGLIDSPDRRGQRVRTPGQVLSEKFGTCLDTTILMAALLGAVELDPVIFLTHNHAFVGYWRDDRWRDHSPFWPLADGRNRVDSGQLVPIETTLLTDQAATYPEALKQAKDKFIECSDITDALVASACAAVDVAVAHRRGTIPIPVRVVLADGTVNLVEYKAQELSIDLLDRAIAGQAGTRAGLQTTDAPRRIKRWMDSLLDLSLRNPLLNYRFPEASSVSLMVPGGLLGRLEDLLQCGGKLRLESNLIEVNGKTVQPLTARHTLPEELRDPATQLLVGQQTLLTTLGSEQFIGRLRRMQSTARSIIDESGSNQLYLAMGMVVWVPEGRPAQVNAPLILVPVMIRSSNRSREFALEIDMSSPVTPNFSLAERLKTDARLNLTKLVEPDLDDAGVDIDGLIAYVRDEFNRAGLTDYRVDESCTLGFFDFSTYRLWRDLKENWARFVANSPLVRHLVETPTNPFQDPTAAKPDGTIDDFAASLPVLADGSQARAVRDAVDGKTFVLQGPPGTGKSQTITNLLARALHSGQRVLFVAEKPDALAVVRDRLQKVGLGAFGLNLHDKGMRTADVRAQIGNALDASGLADRVGFEAAERTISRTIAPLQRYPERLHKPGRFGESAYSARNKLLALGEGPTLPVGAAFLGSGTADSLADARRRLSEVRDAGPLAGSAGENPWSLARISATDLTPQMVVYLRSLTRRASEQLQAVGASTPASSYLGSIASLGELLAVAPLASRTYDLAMVDAAATPAMVAARRHITQTIEGFDTARLFAGAAPQTLSAPVGDLQALAQSALASFFIGRKKRVIGVCGQVQRFLGASVAMSDANLLQVLAEIARLQDAARAYVSFLQSIPGIVLPPGFNVLDPAARASVVEQVRLIEGDVALAASDGSPERGRLRAFLAVATPDAARSIGLLASAVRELLELTRADASALELWSAGRRIGDVLTRSVERWALDIGERDALQLRRWVRMWDLVGPLAARGLGDSTRAVVSGSVNPIEADEAFERGFLTGVLRRQLEDEGLDAFDGDQHDSLVRGFTSAAAQLRRLSPGVLADDMIRARGFDAGVTVGAIGELRRELGKQRQTKPIRRLLKEHWHVISQVTPLVLAIPDALVRFIDGDLEPFDLVVFDEASQIRTAHAIGVLGRGSAAVVVGDEKQMPPSSVAQVRARADETVDEDEADDYEQESILTECTQARVPQISLTWHYRSEDESLIAFSNDAYYKGQLSTLPAPRPRVAGKGLSFVRVDGTFTRQGRGAGPDAGTNEVEAQAIVEEVVRRLKDPESSRHSIGVVTFNRPQQRLIQARLIATEDPVVLKAIDKEQTPEPVTVWNWRTSRGASVT